MSTSRINRRFSLVGTLILSTLSLGALALPLNPATAQCLGVDLGLGCAGLGVGSWYSRPYSYGYPTYYGPTYYGPSYYGYPSYLSPTHSYPSYSYPSYSYSYPSYSDYYNYE